MVIPIMLSFLDWSNITLKKILLTVCKILLYCIIPINNEKYNHKNKFYSIVLLSDMIIIRLGDIYQYILLSEQIFKNLIIKD